MKRLAITTAAGVTVLAGILSVATIDRQPDPSSSSPVPADVRSLGLLSPTPAATARTTTNALSPVHFYSIVADTAIPPGTTSADVYWCAGMQRKVPLVGGKIVYVTPIRALGPEPGNCEAVMVFLPSKKKSQTIRWAWEQKTVGVQ